MIDAEDMAYCEDAIRHGSLSFHAASKVLPAHVRNPALALYAFCRLADDEVDLKADKVPAVRSLQNRMDAAYAGCPLDTPVDRAFASMVKDTDMPKALPEALLEGLAWDAMGRRYQSLSELRSYSARVASAVGVMMCVLMGIRDRNAVARACDLGVAMQLTNIARDVGEDALEGRLYLPIEWMNEAGLDIDEFLANPKSTKAIRQMVRRLVVESERLYLRSESGITKLPLTCRPGIFAARYIYAGIGSVIREQSYQTIATRARTSKGRKISLMGMAILRAASGLVMPQSAVLYAKPLPEVDFLVTAVSSETENKPEWSDKFFDAMAQLKSHDNKKGMGLIG
ncbi:MAG: phytoene synthase [Aestuariivita sp.]|nr:phytoene synthase [Aestuariivita sp.]